MTSPTESKAWDCVCGSTSNAPDSPCIICDGRQKTHDLEATPKTPEGWAELTKTASADTRWEQQDAARALGLHVVRLISLAAGVESIARSHAAGRAEVTEKLKEAKGALRRLSAGWTTEDMIMVCASLDTVADTMGREGRPDGARYQRLSLAVREMVGQGAGSPNVAVSVLEQQLVKKRGGKPERWLVFETWEGPLRYRFMGDVSDVPNEGSLSFFGEEADPLLPEHEVEIRGVTYHALTPGPADVRERVLDLARRLRFDLLTLREGAAQANIPASAVTAEVIQSLIDGMCEKDRKRVEADYFNGGEPVQP